MNDRGFVFPDAARRVLRRMRLRAHLSAAHRLIPALLDRLDQAGDAAGNAPAPLAEGAIALGQGHREGCLGCGPIDLVKSQDVREQELLQGAHLMLQLLDALGDALGHGLFPSPSISRSGLELTADPATPHRLSESAK